MFVFKLPKIKLPKSKSFKINKKGFLVFILVVIVSSFFGFVSGIISSTYLYDKLNISLPFDRIIEKETVIEKEYIAQTSHEDLIIKVVEEVSPSVVSIIITKDVPILKRYPFEGLFDSPYYEESVERQEIGGGSGFIISEDGLVVTNKHVVLDKEADYTVFTNDGEEYSAKVLARDPVQDLAILEIKSSKSFPVVKLGDSDNLQIGQTVIAIGNALGEFRNTVSIGVVSGLGRRITASGDGFIETIEDVIQTDTAINKGNSGGPLINLRGEVIGINTAIIQEAQSIGFAIPINKAKKDIEQVKSLGKIVHPFLGIRYVLLTEELQELNDLSVGYGAFIVAGKEDEPGIILGSAADKAGLEPGDIILEVNQEKVSLDNTLAEIIVKYEPGDEVMLKYLREEEIKFVRVTLDERSE